MSYRQPTGEPYWQSTHGSTAPDPYHQHQRHPQNAEFHQTTNFGMEEFLPFNNGIGQRHQPQMAGSVGAGYSYNPQFQGVDPTFSSQGQGHGGWTLGTQVSAQEQLNKLPEYRPIFSGNHDLTGPMQDQTAGGLPQTEQSYPPQSVLHRQGNLISDQGMSGIPWGSSDPSRGMHQDQTSSLQLQRTQEAPVSQRSGKEMHTTQEDSIVSEQTDQQQQETNQHEPPGSPDKIDRDGDTVTPHQPNTKAPGKRKANGTQELSSGETSSKKTSKKNSSDPSPGKPRNLPDNVGDVCYCEVCDLVCSGPLNLRMHVNGSKHRSNEAKALKGEAPVVSTKSNKKLLGRFGKAKPIPSTHDQDETPVIGLDFMTRVVIPHQDETKDLFDCSLCDEKDLVANDVYSHVQGEEHKKAYIRKFKPDLADQYSTIANVYNMNAQLQRRRSSDLSALLNSIVKIAAKRDGPGEMQIRLCNEKEESEGADEDADNFGVGGYSSGSEDFDEMPSGDPVRSGEGDPSWRSVTDRPSRFLPMPAIPRAPYTRQDPQPLLQRLLRPQQQPKPSNLKPEGATPETPNLPATNRRPARITSPEGAPSRIPPLLSSHPLPSSSSPSVMRSSQPPGSSNNHLQTPPPPTPPATRLPPKLPPASEESTRRVSKPVPVDLPALTDDQLRCYCSDVFIAQEYRRRFGDPTPPSDKQEQADSVATTNLDGVSLESMLRSLSDTIVHSEDDANIAMELTRALTQATLKFRLQEKGFALKAFGK